MNKIRDKSAAAFYLLAAAGIIICVLTELEKYSPAIRALCGGDTGGCQEVGSSPYSTLFGISVGVWGIISYIAWMLIYRRRREWAGIYGGAILGAEIYFVYLQLFVIKAVCVLCMAQFAVVALINVLLFFTAYPAAGKSRYRIALVPVIIVSFFAFYIPMKVEASKTATLPSAPSESRLAGVMSWGDPSSPYRMELFSDYQCGFCGKFESPLKKIMKEYPQIHIVFRDFIIGSHPHSPMAVAYAGSVAYAQGKDMYMKTRFEIFENQQNILDYLNERMPYVKDDFAMKRAVDDKVREDRKRAKALGVSGTPTIVLSKNGKVEKIVRGYVPYRVIKKDLNRLVGR